MRIATYNVNGVNGRLPVLLRWLGGVKPDIICLQELKAPDEKFPAKAIEDAGYGAIWHGQQRWNGVAIIIAGDYNIIPTDNDVYKPERWLDDALFAPEAKAAYARILKQGWTDALRKLYPSEKVYTFWKYWRGAFERDAGLRIDHLLLNKPAAKKLKAAGVDRTARSWEKTSDHAPVWVELK